MTARQAWRNMLKADQARFRARALVRSTFADDIRCARAREAFSASLIEDARIADWPVEYRVST